MKEMFKGSVIFFNAKTGYGFISWEKDGQAQPDLFLHYSDINCEGFRTVRKGQKVSFAIGVNNKNQPKAIEVIALDDTK
jgi:CspA family cold shock protein